MEERSLKVLAADTTFFNRISNTLTKLLMPTKIGLNGFLITIKRTNAIKAFENLENVDDTDSQKKEQLTKRFDESYTLYLESIDKYIMDSIYKKVKNGTASSYEREALSNYYNIVHLKENEYVEYKYQKQKFLLEVDYQNVLSNEKEKMIPRYEKLYIKKIDAVYKGILKHYSVKLADGQKEKNNSLIETYRNIFSILEEYIKEILPIKLKTETLGGKNVSLSLEEVLSALAICAVTNPTAEHAMEKLEELKNLQAHSTTIISKDDEQTFRKLGIDVTCDAEYATESLFYNN